MSNRHRNPPRGTRTSGFTLVELTISMLILTVVIVGVLALFDSTNQLAKSQLLRVDLQQSLRVGQREVVRTVRLAGRGGLLLSADNSRLPANGWAIAVDNNVRSTAITPAAGAPDVVDDTDVLTLRGVLNTPVYLLEHLNPASFTIDTANDEGTMTILDVTPESNRTQDLEPLCEMLTDGTNRPEALLMVSAFDDRLFATAEIDYDSSDASGCPAQVTLGFNYGTALAVNSYTKLSTDGENPGVFPENFLARTRVGSVGILEEYRFYLRRTPDGEYARKLSRARVYPNTDDAYAGDDGNLSIDTAENVIDFQVALAFDLNGDGEITETEDGVDDEWFGNSDEDKADEPPWSDNSGTAAANDGYLAENAPLFRYLRLTTLARTAEGDRNHMARELIRLEDHAYSSTDPLNETANDTERKYPRIVLRSTVELRNL
jgi:type II secretory pathway pseudopilin PulG